MSIMNEGFTGSHNPLKTLELKLQQEIARGKNKKEADFKEAYPLIEQYLANKVLFKVVLETFNTAYGYTLHPPRFRKMLFDERKRRAETNDVVVCATCGHSLTSAAEIVELSDNKEDK